MQRQQRRFVIVFQSHCQSYKLLWIRKSRDCTWYPTYCTIAESKWPTPPFTEKRKETFSYQKREWEQKKKARVKIHERERVIPYLRHLFYLADLRRVSWTFSVRFTKRINSSTVDWKQKGSKCALCECSERGRIGRCIRGISWSNCRTLSWDLFWWASLRDRFTTLIALVEYIVTFLLSFFEDGRARTWERRGYRWRTIIRCWRRWRRRFGWSAAWWCRSVERRNEARSYTSDNFELRRHRRSTEYTFSS